MPLGTALVVGGLGLLAAWWLSQEDKGPPGGTTPTTPGDWTDKAKSEVFETRLVDGLEVRFFRPDVVEGILDLGAKEGLQTTPIPSGFEGGAVYRVVPSSPGRPMLRSAIMTQAGQGLVVVGNLDMALPQSQARFIAIVPRSMLNRATDNAASAWAVILAAPYGQPPPGVRKGDYPPGDIPPDQPPPGVNGGWDANMPAQLRAQLDALVQDDGVDPAALDYLADMYASTYPKAAKRLRARAAELRERTRLEHVQKGRSPFTIRQGDTGSRLALYYTGDASRWKEIPSVNQDRGMKVQTVKGVTQLVPWSGVIHLPLSWEIWTKPLPPAAGAPAKTEADDLKKKAEDLMKELGKMTTGWIQSPPEEEEDEEAGKPPPFPGGVITPEV